MIATTGRGRSPHAVRRCTAGARESVHFIFRKLVSFFLADQRVAVRNYVAGTSRGLISGSMTNAEQYRAQAAAQRALAAQSELANRRDMHERSAIMWDEMAQLAEDTIERALVNAAAKAPRG